MLERASGWVTTEIHVGLLTVLMHLSVAIAGGNPGDIRGNGAGFVNFVQ